jgi:psiF repeat
MLRSTAAIAVALAVMLQYTPSFAVSAKAKMATCKFGADDQKLQGKARAAFMKKCMSNKDEPRGAAPAMPAAGAPPPPPPPPPSQH